MKKYIVLSIIFGLPALVGLFVLEKIIRKIPNSYQYKNEWMTLHAKEVQVLILGNSHTHSGINPEYFLENTFNLANPGQDLERDYFLLSKYIDNCLKLQYIILPLDYYNLFLNMEDSQIEKRRLINYNIYMDYNNRQNYEFEILNGGIKKIKAYYLNNDIKLSDLHGFAFFFCG